MASGYENWVYYQMDCFRNCLESFASGRDSVDDLDPELAKKKLKSLSIIAFMALKDPSMFDAVRNAEDHRKAMEAYEAGECLSLDEFTESLKAPPCCGSLETCCCGNSPGCCHL